MYCPISAATCLTMPAHILCRVIGPVVRRGWRHMKSISDRKGSLEGLIGVAIVAVIAIVALTVVYGIISMEDDDVDLSFELTTTETTVG